MDSDVIWNVFCYYLEGFHFWLPCHTLVPSFREIPKYPECSEWLFAMFLFLHFCPIYSKELMYFSTGTYMSGCAYEIIEVYTVKPL